MILVIKNGYIQTFIGEYLDDNIEIVNSYEKDVMTLDLGKYSVIIILGGHQSVCNNRHISDELRNVMQLIEQCIMIQKPVIGICLGCHMIGRVLGCEIRTSGKLNLDYDTKILDYECILRCHSDYVVPNDKITVLSYFDSMPYLIKYNNIYGIQCHPDIPPEKVHIFLNQTDILNFTKEHTDIINHNNRKLLSFILNEIVS